MIWMSIAGGLIAISSCLLTGATLRFLKRRAILDHPNERSSHTTPIPRGGGIAIVVITLILWAVPVQGTLEDGILFVLCGAILIAAISWFDDIRPLSPLIRICVQALAVAVAVNALSSEGLVFQGIFPAWLDTGLSCLLWLWFINLFNFMDGIDAISGIETVCICGGLLVLAAFQDATVPASWLSMTLAAATLGFLWWNCPPAKIFLGDIGSITIGFLLGWLLLKSAIAGYWASALILPLYYLGDATITLVKRGLRGEKVWRAHREHFYQRAVQSGKSHGTVSSAILAANFALIGLAYLAVTSPIIALIIATMVVAVLMIWMRG
jgi:UDP-N-acetylmuramyl pentapeptide phosphotransferase/UDP-N-acetylglucosamine-1-phosphate transferase